MGSGIDIGQVPKVSIPINPTFGWSVGNWMEYFFDGIKEGKLRASKCPACGRVFLPPRMVCERCFAKCEDWVKLPETGTVQSFTTAHVKVGADGELEDLSQPEIIVLVKQDGADTCVAARLEGESASVGMKVKAVLDPSAENFLDMLAGYRPAE
ncbi:MAG: Zn-ribbon domain-containing OB-fold protein [Actinomycetota bacterium]|nr:Zn-ribbon domain-containing OB-fold protein [Actinomycetota bacterium]